MKRPTVYMMMGGPASGKSSVRRKELPGLPVVDCDNYKPEHPDYDPKDILPHVHEYSVEKCKREFYSKLGTGEDFVFDGTGSNAEKYVKMAADAHDAGFTVSILYVTCSLTIALARNDDRERTVPEHIVRAKYATIATSFEIVSRYVDEIRVINNDS